MNLKSAIKEMKEDVKKRVGKCLSDNRDSNEDIVKGKNGSLELEVYKILTTSRRKELIELFKKTKQPAYYKYNNE